MTRKYTKCIDSEGDGEIHFFCTKAVMKRYAIDVYYFGNSNVNFFSPLTVKRRYTIRVNSKSVGMSIHMAHRSAAMIDGQGVENIDFYDTSTANRRYITDFGS